MPLCLLYSFFFTDTATTEIYTLSLHDALPISTSSTAARPVCPARPACCSSACSPISVSQQPREPQLHRRPYGLTRSEEHTSELQSRRDLVCRLLLEKKKKIFF